MEKPSPYQAYLIRLWSTRRGGVDGCRVSLQFVATGLRTNFPDLESLLAFLRAQADEWPNQECPEDGSDYRRGRSAPQH